MDGFKNRLLEFIETSYGVSQRRFEEMCGLSNGTITSIKVKGPSADVVTKISYTCPELNLNWLFRGTGNMLLDNPDAGTPHQQDTPRGAAANKEIPTPIEVSVVKTAGAVIISDVSSLEAIVKDAVAKAISKV